MMDRTAADADGLLETIAGRVSKVIYHQADSGFCVLIVEAREFRGAVTVVGTLATGAIAEGDEVECSGSFKIDKVRGRQFKTDMILITPPGTAAGIERYLASGMVRGVGPVLAKKLVEAFGADTVRVIDHEPERLLELHGIGPSRLEALREAWAEQRGVRDVMIFLRTHGVGAARAVKIHKKYGDKAIELITEDPYRLERDIHGIGFLVADAIARSMGTPFDAPQRARAGVVHVMQELAMGGHCAATLDTLMAAASKLLGAADAILAKAIEDQIRIGALVKEPLNGVPVVYLAHLRKAEADVADSVARILMGGGVPWGEVDPGWAVEWAKDMTDLTLADSQRDAMLLALASKMVVITGGPGVGKTTIVKSILSVAQARGSRVTLCAPTGRAAKRLAESTKQEAKTIHRTLEFDPVSMGFRRGKDYPLETDLLVVDEASMVDVTLMAKLLAAVPDHAALMVVGDADQLPSVGPGNVLSDLIASGSVPTVRLTEIFRQAAGSMIITNAHKINQGLIPEGGQDGTSGADFFLIRVPTPELVLDRLIQTVTERIPKAFGLDPIRDIQVLTPMNKGGLGTVALNVELRKRLNPSGYPKVSRFGSEFAVGDKVLQMVNDYDKEVFNGDIGRVRGIDLEHSAMLVDFEGRDVAYGFDELDELSLAYATSIHKSQGSEYPCVVIPLASQHHMLLERNLIYTAVTRGKGLVVVICQPAALDRAVGNRQAKARLTGLAGRIAAEVDLTL
jgi:exodeoxyribonuclease V alpha subunit